MAKHIEEGEFEEGTRRYEKRAGMLPRSANETAKALEAIKLRKEALNRGPKEAPATVDQSTDFSQPPGVNIQNPAEDVKSRTQIMKEDDREY